MSDLLHNLGVIWQAIGIVIGSLMVFGTVLAVVFSAWFQVQEWRRRRQPEPVRITRTPTLPSDWRPYQAPTTRSWN